MNLFEQIDQIETQMNNLCSWDNHNELQRLEALKRKTQEKIRDLFTL